jgi:hypothetical protein
MWSKAKKPAAGGVRQASDNGRPALGGELPIVSLRDCSGGGEQINEHKIPPKRSVVNPYLLRCSIGGPEAWQLA